MFIDVNESSVKDKSFKTNNFCPRVNKINVIVIKGYISDIHILKSLLILPTFRLLSLGHT